MAFRLKPPYHVDNTPIYRTGTDYTINGETKTNGSIIIANEDPSYWKDNISKYITNPIDSDEGRIKEIREIAYEHQVDDYLASILYNSKI